MTKHTEPGFAGLGLALGLALSPLVALGFSRFAYALLLPPMQNEFAWSFVKAGALNTSNALGYVVGALLASWLGSRWGTLKVFTWAMVASALALMATAAPSSFTLLLAVRAAGGLATAVAFVLGTALAARAMPGRTATSLSIYFAGSGLGVVLAGTLIPLSQASGESLDWRMAWLYMGVASLAAVSAIAWNASGLMAPAVSGSQLAQSSPAQIVVTSPQGPVVRDARLEELLAAHRQFGGASALQESSGFLRNATFEMPRNAQAGSAR